MISKVTFLLSVSCVFAQDTLVDVSGAKNLTVTLVSEGHAWSGGWCLASLASAGWLRSSTVNPLLSKVLLTSVKAGLLPMVTGSNSGGSMFAIRYFALRSSDSATKWSYPCYLLTEPYRTVCYYHSGFGDISAECESEKMNVLILATVTVYGGVMAIYGGPMGTASVFLLVYFPFLSGLPLKEKSLKWSAFTQKYAIFSTRFDLPSNWVPAHSLDSPLAAGKPLYNYGFDSFLSRGCPAYSVQGSTWSANALGNVSASWVAAVSANAQTGFVMLPYALASKAWDASTGSNALAPVMQVFALLVSFLQVKKLASTMQIVTLEKGMVHPKECPGGCPIMDGGFTDNVPLTPVVSAAALVNPNRPSYILSLGCTSTMTAVKYLLGSGPLGLYTMVGVNVCPFSVGGICTMLSKVRELVVGSLVDAVRSDYYDIANAYQIFRPEQKVLTPYCGDPLTYDLFAGKCLSESACDMWASVLPSSINKIPFTADVYSIVFVMAFLQATKVSARFVYTYMPQDMWLLSYYSNMDAWFPNYDAISPEKGGLGFTNLAGNSLLDFMTYLTMRLVGFLEKGKENANKLASGNSPPCYYTQYRQTEKYSYNEPAFLLAQSSVR